MNKTLIALKALIILIVLGLFSGCANQGEPARLSTTYGHEGDFNSNNSMPSAW